MNTGLAVGPVWSTAKQCPTCRELCARPMVVEPCPVKQEISKRFAQNLTRVEKLLALFPDGAGRRDTATTDFLRAGVVFLHATLEDLFRSLLEWKLPVASAHVLNDVPLVGCKPRTRFTLDDLASHRDKTVDEVIRESIIAHLLDTNFNHPGDLAAALDKVSISRDLLRPHRDKLGPMMWRRHWIVHRADRNEATGTGQHATLSLGRRAVQRWLEAVRGFGEDVLKKC